MTNDTLLALTPEQVAALDAANGPVYAQDPATLRRFALVEQPQAERLTAEELRAMLHEGINELDRGEGVPWDPEEIKRELREEYRRRGLA